MSASTPGRYRSRLFNLINHHSRRFIDRGERAIRHLKVAAVWGKQILLYPIYMVVQTSLTAGRQLSAEAKTGWTRLKALTQSQPPEQPPAVDTPIQRVLKEVETLPLPKPSQWKQLQPVGDQERQIVGAGLTDNVTQETDNLTKPALLGKEKGKKTFSTGRLKPQLHKQNLPTQVSQSSRVEIQGVATLLTTRTLVLVSIANEILDILTPEQQQKLAARISWELANLYRQWRLVDNLKTSRVQRQLSHLAKPSLFLPVRLFWQLMAWVQTSPVAIAINLFGESTLSDYQEPMPAIASPTEIPQSFAYSWLKRFARGGTLAAIDDTIAQWEAHPRKTSNQVANNSENRAFVNLSPATFLAQTYTSSTDPLLSYSSSQLSFTSAYCPLPPALSSPPEKPISYAHNHDIEPAPDWIETEAISTGYVKHPLEQILEWLDVGMLWLEKVTIKAWRWMRQFFAKDNA